MKKYLVIGRYNFISGLLIIYSLFFYSYRVFRFTTRIEHLLLSFLADSFIIILFFALINIRDKKIHLIDALVFVFIFFNILSGFNIILLNSTYPQLYFYGLHMSVLPIILYFGTRFTNFKSNKMLYTIWQIGLIHIVIGIITFSPIIRFFPSIIRPFLYHINYLYTSRLPESFKTLERMRSCFGSIAFGNIAGITTLLSFYFTIVKKTKYYYFVLFLSLIAVILSNQRGAWIATLVGLFILLLFIKSRNKRIKILVLIGLIFVCIIIINSILPVNFKNYLNYRFIDLVMGGEQAIGGRIGQWYYALDIIKNNPFGVGVGTLGYSAIKFVHYGIPDGNYFKILAEMGIIGFSSFLLIILSIISRFILILQNKQYIYDNGEKILMFALLIFYLIQAVGTNVFDLYYSNVVFWLILGFYFRGKSKVNTN